MLDIVFATSTLIVLCSRASRVVNECPESLLDQCRKSLHTILSCELRPDGRHGTGCDCLHRKYMHA